MAKIANKFKTPTIFTVMAVMLIICIFPVQAIAETVPVYDSVTLIEQAKSLDGETVVFDGEIIGDIMPRQDHYWINVLNKGTAIGVWITGNQRETLTYSGQYGIQGDIVRITGQFKQACAEHGGDLDIHADSLEILQQGSAISRRLDSIRLLSACILFSAACICLLLLIKKRFWKRY